MHQDFCEKFPTLKVSLETYRRQVKIVNISLKMPACDISPECEKYSMAESVGNDIEEMDFDTHEASKKRDWEKHIEHARKATNVYQSDAASCSSDSGKSVCRGFTEGYSTS